MRDVSRSEEHISRFCFVPLIIDEDLDVVIEEDEYLVFVAMKVERWAIAGGVMPRPRTIPPLVCSPRSLNWIVSPKAETLSPSVAGMRRAFMGWGAYAITKQST